MLSSGFLELFVVRLHITSILSNGFYVNTSRKIRFIYSVFEKKCNLTRVMQRFYCKLRLIAPFRDSASWTSYYVDMLGACRDVNEAIHYEAKAEAEA